MVRPRARACVRVCVCVCSGLVHTFRLVERLHTKTLTHSHTHALPHAHTIVAGLVEADVSGTLASSSTLEAIDAAASNHRLRITMLHCSPHGHVGLDRVVRSLSSHAVACVKLCRCTHHLTLGEHQLADAKCSVVLK